MIPLKDYNPTRRRAVMTLLLIAANVFVYFFVQPHGTGLDPRSAAALQSRFTIAHAAIPCEVVHQRPLSIGDVVDRCGSSSDPRQPFPHKNVDLAVLYSMFLHGSLLHIGGNMLFLWIFGNNIEDALGAGAYLLFYLVSGVVAAAAYILTQPSSPVPIVGASGAIAGVMGAYLVLFPDVRIRSLIFVGFFVLFRDVAAKWLLAFWFVLQFFTSPGSGVAWMAHVGGFAFGALIGLLLRAGGQRARSVPTW
ncbi:MAG: rhomboid family intramembrane serine protease [Acidimicrobiales bacterium]